MPHRIGVVGAGYVGLTTAACLAHLGHEVVCVDIDEDRIALLRKGEIPILERHLPVLVSEGLDMGRLRFEAGTTAAAEGTAFVFLCVPTPQNGNGSASLRYVEAATQEIAPVLTDGAIVILKSTSPVGTTRSLQRILTESGAPPGVRAACNPEFLREGRAVEDFLHPDRVVIGCDDPETAGRLRELYRGVDAPIVVTDPASAEMIKYASNAYLAARISYINAIANLCEAVGADVEDVALGMGHDARIGPDFLHPGPGYGGSCFPKDTAALLYVADSVGVDLAPVRATVEVNEAQRERIVAKIERAAGRDLATATVAVWGLTFKANTDACATPPPSRSSRRCWREAADPRGHGTVLGDRVRGRRHRRPPPAPAGCRPDLSRTHRGLTERTGLTHLRSGSP